ncbi:uncharacterized protein [Pempheris klunzingeri]|uniref:uncharacterized protein n=1 Tax=Pempheris klunzingeri TaxID=3127111 RepID=UPI00397F6911
MASTTQSALDYVQRARPRLVEELRDLSLILENLNQQGVLSAEEVSRIQSRRNEYDQTREILSSVTKKGEAACYMFLRIIDMTRKRTLGRPASESKNQAPGDTKNFDLHHWISCYPFNEDTPMDIDFLQGPSPCHRYQKKLKFKARKISNDFWMANRNLFEENNKPGLSYTSLVLDTKASVCQSKIKKLKRKKSKMSRPKKMRKYMPEDEPTISPSELLKMDRDVLLVGKPGIGKTALALEILKLWAERDNAGLDYMFYFDMRKMSHVTTATSLKELLFGEFVEPDEGREEVLQDMERNCDSVTVIFDGITDLSSSVVLKLVEKDLLPDAKIIVTCRPDDEDEFSPEDFLRVEVKGFNEQTIRGYLSETLGGQQEKVLNNVELLTLCHVPMYALMVAACFSSEETENSPQPCSITEIYINIARFCLQRSSNRPNKRLNTFISSKRTEILCLAEVSFHATEQKSVNLTAVPSEDSCVLSFLKPLVIKEAVTETTTIYAFLHYTVQEFFAALWLLKHPEKIKDVLQQCLTEEKKHMKHVIPFMCRLLTEKKPSLMSCLIPAEELKETSQWFFREMITTFSQDSGLDVGTLFSCQCLFESQCPEACDYFLNKLNYHLDLSGETVDPFHCCAVAYVVAQAKTRKTRLNLEGVTVSEQGVTRLFGCLHHVQWCDPLRRQLWEIVLLSKGQKDYVILLGLDENQLHLPVEGKGRLFGRAVKVMQKVTTKVNVCLHWGNRASLACQSLCECLSEALPFINSLSFRTSTGSGRQEDKELVLDLFLAVALHKGENFDKAMMNKLLSLFALNTHLLDILVDFYQHIKTKGCSSIIPNLKPLFQSAPAVWSINLSERKTSVLLEVLKLQPEKKQVKLTGCSEEESEVRTLLQCLPHISQLSFSQRFRGGVKLLVDLFCAAAEREQQTGEKTVELLSSVCSHETFPFNHLLYDDDDDDDDGEYQSGFLLDLFSHVKDYETKTGLRLLPSVQPVLQSGPAVWSINLSERKTSVLLEVLKLQPEKKQVQLTGCSEEESEVRTLLQCLPHISQLSFSQRLRGGVKLLVDLFCAAAEREQQTGEKTVELLSSVCSHETFPFNYLFYDDDDDDDGECQSGFLLDLFSHVKDYETKTGLRLLPSLQPVLQSAPAVWSINLSERKTSVLLEVLKLQPQKKQVELTGCSEEESEVRTLLQCLPHISQLSFSQRFEDKVKLLADLFCAAAEREQQTGEKTVELLSSVCSHETFPFNYLFYDDDDDDGECQSGFLLDLFSHVKDYETKTGLRLLPSLQPVLQSAPAVWSIDLSERKTSVLLEVLKLQPQKKQVKLTGCSEEESEVRTLLQCLPHISQLSFSLRFRGGVKLLVDLFCAAAEREQQTGEKTVELLSSVCSHETFPFNYLFYDDDDDDDDGEYQSGFLLDLFSHVKDYETKTGLRLLPSVQPVLQSAPAVWSIDLSERKTSVLLEVLKLQPEKKQVKLTGCSEEESEVRTLLQCLPHISQLSFSLWFEDKVKFLVDLFCAAAEREQQTGEKTVELLSSVCSYETFPFNYLFYDGEYQSGFLLDLFSHVKDYETKTGLRLLPSVQPVLQSGPAVWSIDLSERKTSVLLEVLKLQPQKKQVQLTGCSEEESEVRTLLQCLPHISQLSFSQRLRGGVKLLVDLFCAAAEREQQTGEKTVELLSSVCRYKTFPLHSRYTNEEYQSGFLLDLFSHVKDYETKTGLRLLPSLQPVLQSVPAVWSINLSERKTSVLLEVLKLQPQKKQVKLTGCSEKESEVRTLLQCLPHISQLSFSEWFEDKVKFLVDLFCAAAEREQQTGEKTVELLSSVCRYETFPFKNISINNRPLKEYQSGFLLDLFSHVKDYETKTGLRLLPSVQSVLQSAPAVWFINLSERKTSVLLEVLKLQPEKKQVKLTGCSEEESEVRTLLQCLPHISQLSFSLWFRGGVKLLVDLFCAAAEREQQTGEKTVELLSSVCRYKTFPLHSRYTNEEYQSGFLLDLFSHVKDYETKTGLRLLPSLQPVLQSVPAVWSINLSERKTSVLLEVLKLQPEKKEVQLTGCSEKESEVRTLLQCLPHISQLSFSQRFEDKVKLLVDLFCAAAEREQQTGEKTVELLSSVCRYKTFPFNDLFYDDDDGEYQSGFLLDLFSHVKDYETKTGLRLLPSLQPVLQSAPAVWSINLSKRKTSVLLEVLKLQPEKKEVELTGCSEEESEVRTLLQCLPHISQLSFSQRFRGGVKLLVDLFCAAAEREQQTGEKTVELLSSVCRYKTFPLHSRYTNEEYQSGFLLDLFSHVKDYETKTGLRLLPSLQPVLQSGPAVWSINLSERKTSVLLEVLKLQPEKKQVKLTGCSEEESEVRTLLQCLPHISQLSLLLTGELPRKTCRSVGRVLAMCDSDVDLILSPRKMSARGASLLFRWTTQLHSLRLSSGMALLLCRWVRGGRAARLLAVEELSVAPRTARPADRVLLRVVSSLASLLRYWSVRRLDLTELHVPAQGLIPLLLHDGPLTVKLSKNIYQQLFSLLCEIQDQDLIWSFQEKFRSLA